MANLINIVATIQRVITEIKEKRALNQKKIKFRFELEVKEV